MSSLRPFEAKAKSFVTQSTAHNSEPQLDYMVFAVVFMEKMECPGWGKLQKTQEHVNKTTLHSSLPKPLIQSQIANLKAHPDHRSEKPHLVWAS